MSGFPRVISLKRPLAACLAALACAATARSADSDTRSDIVQRADASLASISTMTGRFVQVAPDGDVSRGSYYLRRPGRMRFQYDAPSGLLVVADGTTVAVSDSRLKSFDRFPLSSTALGIFLDSGARLSQHSRILDVTAAADRYYIRIGDRDRQHDQRVVLEFANTDFSLLGWSVVEGTGQHTRIALQDSIVNSDLSAHLFQIQDPEQDRDRRR